MKPHLSFATTIVLILAACSSPASDSGAPSTTPVGDTAVDTATVDDTTTDPAPAGADEASPVIAVSVAGGNNDGDNDGDEVGASTTAPTSTSDSSAASSSSSAPPSTTSATSPSTTTPSTTDTAAPAGGSTAGVVQRIDWGPPFDLGPVDGDEITGIGGFQYATKGFGNGYQDRQLIEVVDSPGAVTGRWARFINPGGLDAHTFSKAIRAVNQDGSGLPTDLDELWIKMELYFDENWATQDQGKLGYSWSGTEGAPSPGTNPTEQYDFLFHYFSPNHRKSSAIWPTTNPGGPFQVGDMVIGLDVYAADSRIGTRFSEPLFLVEEVGRSDRQKLFVAGRHYVLWVHLRLNTPSATGPYDGIIEGWWSEDGGASFAKGVEITDMNWRGDSTASFGKNGLVRFNGGSGKGFEPGGAPNKNTNSMLPVRDYWYYVGDIETRTDNPLPDVLR